MSVYVDMAPFCWSSLMYLLLTILFPFYHHNTSVNYFLLSFSLLIPCWFYKTSYGQVLRISMYAKTPKQCICFSSVILYQIKSYPVKEQFLLASISWLDRRSLFLSLLLSLCLSLSSLPISSHFSSHFHMPWMPEWTRCHSKGQLHTCTHAHKDAPTPHSHAHTV